MTNKRGTVKLFTFSFEIDAPNTAKSGFLNEVKNSKYKNLTLITIFFH